MSCSKAVQTKILIDLEEYRRLEGFEEKFNKAQKQLEELEVKEKRRSQKKIAAMKMIAAL